MPQLETVRLAENAHAIAVVKPQFELGLPTPPQDRTQLLKALNKARDAFLASGWQTPAWIESPVRGRRGSIEFLLHAMRAAAGMSEIAADAFSAPRPRRAASGRSMSVSVARLAFPAFGAGADEVFG